MPLTLSNLVFDSSYVITTDLYDVTLCSHTRTGVTGAVRAEPAGQQGVRHGLPQSRPGRRAHRHVAVGTTRLPTQAAALPRQAAAHQSGESLTLQVNVTHCGVRGVSTYLQFVLVWTTVWLKSNFFCEMCQEFFENSSKG